MKSANTLLSFVSYCVEHPHERFWQALRNWSKYSMVLGVKYKQMSDITDPSVIPEDCVDTFYIEDDE